jgi:hypothetical protein
MSAIIIAPRGSEISVGLSCEKRLTEKTNEINNRWLRVFIIEICTYWIFKNV